MKKLPSFSFGIKELERLKNSDYQKSVKMLGGGIRVNPYGSGFFGEETTASSFVSVMKKTTLKKEILEVFKSKINTLLIPLLEKKPTFDNSVKALINQAYVKMSKKGKNSPKRVAQKKHDNYAFGTGQTLKSITGWVNNK